LRGIDAEVKLVGGETSLARKADYNFQRIRCRRRHRSINPTLEARP